MAMIKEHFANFCLTDSRIIIAVVVHVVLYPFVAFSDDLGN
jgi:hypothetical protein